MDCTDLTMGLVWLAKKGREERVVTDGNTDDNKQDRHGRNEPWD